jgi:hypothetical protein
MKALKFDEDETIEVLARALASVNILVTLGHSYTDRHPDWWNELSSEGQDAYREMGRIVYSEIVNA